LTDGVLIIFAVVSRSFPTNIGASRDPINRPTPSGVVMKALVSFLFF
jgi:hypothetical protein